MLLLSILSLFLSRKRMQKKKPRLVIRNRSPKKLGIKINPRPQAQIPGPKNIGKKKEIIASTKEKEK